MDYITKLSKSENIVTKIKYNSILMAVNKFIKYIHLILHNKGSIEK